MNSNPKMKDGSDLSCPEGRIYSLTESEPTLPNTPERQKERKKDVETRELKSTSGTSNSSFCVLSKRSMWNMSVLYTVFFVYQSQSPLNDELQTALKTMCPSLPTLIFQVWMHAVVVLFVSVGQQSYHPAAQDWLPTEAKLGWAWSLPVWETSWEN